MLLIKNAHLIDPASHTDAAKDILLGDGKVISVKDCIPAEEGMHVIDASGLIAAPGLVDTHSHFRDPGFTYKEDIHTGALSAAKGGYTSVVMMANTKPSIDNPEILKDVLARGAKEKIRIYSAANVTIGMKGEELTDFEALKNAGAVVLTDDGKPILNSLLLRGALLHAKAVDLPVSLHEEDPAYIHENGIHAGAAAEHLHIQGSPSAAEYTMIRRDVQHAIETGAKLCIQHISTKEGVELVRQAKRHNPLIHAEATPHHFSLTEEAVIRCGANAKCNPPIRTEEDRMAIIRGLQDGTIDIIATDHAPHAAEEKAVQPIWKAPSGMIGLETALSLGIRELVNPGYLSMEQLLACLTCSPADYYHLNAGRITEGGPADLVLFDPDEHWTVTDHFASKSSNSPFIGDEMPGVIHYTICRGEIVYEQ